MTCWRSAYLRRGERQGFWNTPGRLASNRLVWSRPGRLMSGQPSYFPSNTQPSRWEALGICRVHKVDGGQR